MEKNADDRLTPHVQLAQCIPELPNKHQGKNDQAVELPSLLHPLTDQHLQHSACPQTPPPQYISLQSLPPQYSTLPTQRPNPHDIPSEETRVEAPHQQQQELLSGEPAGNEYYVPKSTNSYIKHMAFACVVFICCGIGAWLFAVIAFGLAKGARSDARAGRFESARKRGRNSIAFSTFGIVMGIFSIVIFFMLHLGVYY